MSLETEFQLEDEDEAAAAAGPDAEVLTTREAANFLRIGINQLYDAVGRLEVPHRRIGRSIRFSRSGLVQWLGKPCKAASREG